MFDFIYNWTHYQWFFYLGILFFTTHYYINHSSYLIDMSYFGLLLIFIGWQKPALYGWVIILLWIFIGFHILSDIYMLQKRMSSDSTPNKTFTEIDAMKNQNLDETNDDETTDEETNDDETTDDETNDDETIEETKKPKKTKKTTDETKEETKKTTKKTKKTKDEETNV